MPVNRLTLLALLFYPINMQLSTPFNAQQYQPASADGGAPQLPVGEHKCVIIASEPKETNAGGGGYLALTLQIIEGQYNGLTGIWRLHLWSNSADAVNIAQRQMASLCYVTGVFMVHQTEQLHGKPFIAVVKAQTTEEGMKKGYTQVTGCKDVAGNDPGKANGGGGSQAQPQGAYGGPTPTPQGGAPAGPWGGHQQPQSAAGAPNGGQPAQQQPQWGQGAQPQPQPPAQQPTQQAWAGAPAAPGGAAPWAR